MRLRVFPWAALLLLSGSADRACAAPAFERPPAQVRVQLIDLLNLARPIVGRASARSDWSRSVPLERDRDWTVVRFEVRESGTGLFLEVDGQAQFEGAEIWFADGEVRTIDLRSSIRGDGLFELADFGAAREVSRVRLEVRARSARARVGLRLGRQP
jgi:hypothetical protein